MSFARIGPSSFPILQKLDKTFNYYYQDFWDLEGDPRVKSYPLFTSGPWLTLALVGLYLVFVKIIGPLWMRDRKPMNLRRLMVIYNVSMVVLSGYLFYQGCVLLNFGLDTWGCQPSNPNDRSPSAQWFLHVAWIFFASKLVEFADTIFFVLRKKNSQISHLHVIHHSTVPISVWFGFKFSPGGNSAFFPLLNSGIHTLMYTYYGLTALTGDLGLKIPTLGIWKKYLTTMQMGQFVLAIIHGLFSLTLDNCPTHKSFLIINLGNAILFLALFYSFYRKSYSNKAKKLA